MRPAFDKSLQVVVVTTAGDEATTGTARRYERRSPKDKWKAVGEPFQVVVGRSGLAWGDELESAKLPAKIKAEGDGKAPAGRFPLTAAFGTATKPTEVELPYTKLDEYTECVDDTRSSFYNRIVDRMHVGNFDWRSSEKMKAVGDEYALGVFVAYNSFPIVPGRGSCIFLHVWKDASTPTSGCTAMPRNELERIVPWLQPTKFPYLVQLTADDYEKNRKAWNLPKLK